MFSRYKSVFVFPLLIFLGCTNSKNSKTSVDSLAATSLLPYGRATITSDQTLELISSAVHFGISFQGNQCEVYASIPTWLDHNYLQYELDGVYQKRIRISKGQSQPIILSASNDGSHTVWIYKATEAATGPVYIEKILGTNIKAIQNSTAPLIEFIGNSITCGAAADTSEVRCGVGSYHDQHNAYYAYGPRVARKLGANYILSSVSGIGIYRNWNSDGPAMPQVYEKLDFQENNQQGWDFKKYNPKVVSIALGTNDFSNGDGKKVRLPFDSSIFVNRYIKFVQLIKSKYPSAQIAILNSPMVNGSRRMLFENCITTVKQKIDGLFPSDKPVALFLFKPMNAGGCSGHPSVGDHAVLAEELAPFFRELLK